MKKLLVLVGVCVLLLASCRKTEEKEYEVPDSENGGSLISQSG